MKDKLLKHADQLAELGRNDEFIATIAKQLKQYAEKLVSSSETTNDEEDDPGGGGNHPKKPGNP